MGRINTNPIEFSFTNLIVRNLKPVEEEEMKEEESFRQQIIQKKSTINNKISLSVQNIDEN